MGLAVGCRRSVIEHVCGTAFPLVDALLENMVFFPEFLGGFLSFHEIQVRINFLVHFVSPFVTFSLNANTRLYRQLQVCVKLKRTPARPPGPQNQSRDRTSLFRPQIRSLYASAVLSEEKPPARAILTSIILCQRSLSS